MDSGLSSKPLERFCPQALSRFGTKYPPSAALQIGGILLTFHFVALGWVFFALSEPSYR